MHHKTNDSTYTHIYLEISAYSIMWLAAIASDFNFKIIRKS